MLYIFIYYKREYLILYSSDYQSNLEYIAMEIEESKGDFPHLERETKMDDIEFASELQLEEVMQQSKFQSIEELQRAS